MPQIVRLERAPGSDLTAYSARREGEVAGTIAIPTRDHVGTGLFISMMMADWSFLPPGQTVSWQVIEGSILPSQRNELVQRMQGDWILFIDSDMSFQPDAIGRLVKVREEHDLDIVGGLCFQRKDPHQPTMYMRESPTEGGYSFLEKWDSDLVEVDATGFAFVLIHRRVFERMVRVYEERPEFTWPSIDDRAGCGHRTSFVGPTGSVRICGSVRTPRAPGVGSLWTPGSRSITPVRVRSTTARSFGNLRRARLSWRRLGGR